MRVLASHAGSVATPPKISGSFVITASTPAASSRASSARVVDRPGPDGRAGARGRARRPAADTTAWWSISAAAPARSIMRRDTRDERAAQRQRAEPDRRPERPAPRDAVAVLRIREADRDARRAAGEGGEAREVERADDGPLGEPVAHERRRRPRRGASSASGRRGGRRRARQELERLVERRQLGATRAARRASARARFRRGAVADLGEIVGVREHERAVRRGRARRTRSRRRRSASAASNERSVFSGASAAAPRCPTRINGPSPRKSLTARSAAESSSSSPPRAAYSTIIRSVTHSTGARSSVQGRSAFSVTGRTARRSSSHSGSQLAAATCWIAGCSGRLVDASRILLKRSAGQTATDGNSCVSVPEIPSSRLSSPGTDATLSARIPPGSSRSRASRKNSRVAR